MNLLTYYFTFTASCLREATLGRILKYFIDHVLEITTSKLEALTKPFPVCKDVNSESQQPLSFFQKLVNFQLVKSCEEN